MVILICVIIFIIILLQCRVTLSFTFQMENSVSSAFITVYLFGKALKNIKIYPGDKKDKKSGAPKKKRNFQQMKTSFFVLAKLFKRSLVLKEFKLHIVEGTGDASLTAIVYGMLWNIASLVPVILFSEHKIKKKVIRIDANFDKEIFNVDLNCIFSLKIVNIILMCKGFLTEYLKNKKGGDSNVGSSNRRTHDYSHAKH